MAFGCRKYARRWRWTPVLVFATGLSCSVASEAATLNFAPPQTFAVGTQPKAVIAADVNGDGKADLVVANSGDLTVSVLLNTTLPGAGTATFTTYTFISGSSPSALASADFNGDGKPDLVVANFQASQIAVLLNTTPQGAATPSFRFATTFATEVLPISLASSDLNGDGKPDVVVGYATGSAASVLLDTASQGAAVPAFTPQQLVTTEAGAAPRSVAVADIDGDGKPDLIIGNSDGGYVAVFLNRTAPGAATLSFAPQQVVALGSAPVSVACFDVDGDGKPDIVVPYFNGVTGSIGVLLNTTPAGAAAASFAAVQTFASGWGPESLSGVDLDGDGKQDLLFVSPIEDSVSVLLNASVAGSRVPNFAARQTFAVGRFPLAVTTADVNGDGRPDVISANASAGTVSVLINAAPAAVAEIPGLAPIGLALLLLTIAFMGAVAYRKR